MKQALITQFRYTNQLFAGGKVKSWLPLLLIYLMMQPMVTQAQIRAIRPFAQAKALIVGVSDYRHDKIEDLAYADDDAKAFQRLLLEETAWKLDAQDIVLLTNEEATYGKFLAELDQLIEQAQPKDRIILYFAGHGDVEVVSDDKMGYLLFHDASPTTYATGGACMVNTLDEALSRLILEKGAEVILITDACRSGTLAGSQNGGPGATAAVINQLFSNTVKILSCEPDQSSLEDENLDGGRGIFSYYLIKGLSGAADDNNDRYVNLLELERYLVDEVMAASADKQIPTTSGSKGTKLSKVNRQADPVNPELNLAETETNPVSIERDTPLIQKFIAFGKAIEEKKLLAPKGSSAYDLYRSMGTGTEAESFKKVMKISLLSVLQEDAQKALNDYVTSPGKELARRWSDADTYDRYPEYLDTAAELLGEQSSFYTDIKSRAHYFRGVNLRLQGERAGGSDSLYHLAMAEQDKALALQPVAPHIYNERGLIHHYFKNRQQELLAFQMAHTLSPRWGLALTNLALAYKLLEKLSEAETTYLEAIKLDDKLSATHFFLAVLYEQEERFAEAEVAYRAAVGCPDPEPDAYYNLAKLLFYQPGFYHPSDSKRFLQSYLTLKPDDVYAKLMLGTVNMYLGDLETADSLMQAANRESPDDYYILTSLADLGEQKRDYPSAITHLKAALAANPSVERNRIVLSAMYLADGQLKESINTLKELFETGYTEYKNIEGDDRFFDLLKAPDFIKLLDEYFPDR